MSACATDCDAQRLYRYAEPWQHGKGCPQREVPEMRYMDDLKADNREADERMEAIRLHVETLGALINAEDAISGQGASTYASVTFAIRDVYMELRSKRRIHV